MLGFVEEIVLLQLDEHGKLVELPLSAADVVLAGAALMELALRSKVDTDLNRFFVVDREPTGDEILDDALSALVSDGNEATTSAAIELIALNAGRYRDVALKRLVEKGVLREEEGRFLWVFHTRRYPVIDDTEQREVRTRLRQLILTDEIPDPRDVVLLCLIDACGLLGLVLSLDEIAARRERIEQLARLDLIGQAMTKAVGEIRFIIQYASAPIH
ncbi:MAG: GPP34 family phosphoprotein [Alphaproteobacteria bacterium]